MFQQFSVRITLISLLTDISGSTAVISFVKPEISQAFCCSMFSKSLTFTSLISDSWLAGATCLAYFSSSLRYWNDFYEFFLFSKAKAVTTNSQSMKQPFFSKIYDHRNPKLRQSESRVVSLRARCEALISESDFLGGFSLNNRKLKSDSGRFHSEIIHVSRVNRRCLSFHRDGNDDPFTFFCDRRRRRSRWMHEWKRNQVIG